jgi:hypothetical protein
MKIKLVKYIETAEIELIPKIGLRISQPDFIDMEWKWTYREILISFRFLVFAIGVKIYF